MYSDGEELHNCYFCIKMQQQIYEKHITYELVEMFSWSLALKKGLFALIFPQRGKNMVNCWQIKNV